MPFVKNEMILLRLVYHVCNVVVSATNNSLVAFYDGFGLLKTKSVDLHDCDGMGGNCLEDEYSLLTLFMT